MAVSVTEISPDVPVLTDSPDDEALEVRNRQALILEGLQQLPIAQQKFILTLIDFLLDRLDISREGQGSEEVDLPSAIECFRRGWEDVLSGNTVPLEQLWDGVE